MNASHIQLVDVVIYDLHSLFVETICQVVGVYHGRKVRHAYEIGETSDIPRVPMLVNNFFGLVDVELSRVHFWMTKS